MKIRLLIVLAICTSFHSVFCQGKSNIELLLKQLKQPNVDTALADTYNLLCYNYCTYNPDSALWYGNKGMELSVKINYQKGIADAYNNLGWAYYSKGDLIKAKDHINKSLELFKKIGIKEYIAVPLSNLANIYVDESDYPRALSSYAQAFQYSQDAGEETQSAEMLFSMGRIYDLENNPQKARSYFQQAYEIHKKLGNDIYMAQSLSSIANTYQLEEKYDTALSFYKQVLSVFIKHNDIYRIGNTYENIAIAYENKEQYSQALKNMHLAEKYYERLDSKIDLAYAYSGLGEIHYESNHFDSALYFYKLSLKIASGTTEKNIAQSALAGLSGVYFKTNDYKNAYLFLDSSYKIKDSLFTKDKQDELLKLQTEFETERKEKENELLKTQNLTSSLQLEHNREFLIATISCLLISGILLFALYRNRQSKIKNIQSLRELNTQLQEQKKEIIRINTILELKALRAQMNPHFIFNCMSSIQECILTGRIDDANSYLTKLSRLLRMVLNASDEENISLDKELQILNLYLQLEKIRLKNNFDYSIDMSEDIITEELQVPALILQPFAENAIWHGLVNKSCDRQLTIKGNITDNKLHFTILDNGIGRKKAEGLKPEVRKHQPRGIALIEKRVSIINSNNHGEEANFIIHDLYDKDNIATGTCVEIQLPLAIL